MKLSKMWGDPEGYPLVEEFSCDGDKTIKVYSTRDYLMKRAGHIKHVWMFIGEEPVGYMKFFDSSNMTYPGKNVICDVEVSDRRRGSKLSRELYRNVMKSYGPLWRTGMRTIAIDKATQGLDIQTIYPDQERLKDGDYSFVIWGEEVNVKTHD